jgi:hypothetical protein
MSASQPEQTSKKPRPKTLVTHLVAGGAAGLIEACSCHPLDTIKVRMQLSKSGARNAAVCIHFKYLQFIQACPYLNLNVLGKATGICWCWSKDRAKRILLCPVQGSRCRGNWYCPQDGYSIQFV